MLAPDPVRKSSSDDHIAIHFHSGETDAGASYDVPEHIVGSLQMPLDPVDETSMQSFPCSDPPSHSGSHV